MFTANVTRPFGIVNVYRVDSKRVNHHTLVNKITFDLLFSVHYVGQGVSLVSFYFTVSCWLFFYFFFFIFEPNERWAHQVNFMFHFHSILSFSSACAWMVETPTCQHNYHKFSPAFSQSNGNVVAQCFPLHRLQSINLVSRN